MIVFLKRFYAKKNGETEFRFPYFFVNIFFRICYNKKKRKGAIYMKKIILFLLTLCMFVPMRVNAAEECDHEWHEYVYTQGDVPDCTADITVEKICIYCQKEETEVRKGPGHQWGEWVTYDTSCESPGKKVRYCNNCYASEEGTVPALGHDYGPWEVEEYPTAFDVGLKTRECRTCWKEDTQVIPKIKPAAIKTKTEKAISKSVASFFRDVKKYNIKKLRGDFSCQSILFSNKKYMAAYVRSSNKKHLKYAIKSISASKKTAVVRVYCQYQNCYDSYTDAMDDVVMYLAGHLKASNNTIDKYQYQRTKHYNRKYQTELEDKVITLKMKKVNGKWKISKFTKSINDMIHCNYQSAYDDYF